eukprot:1159668-Pelagomonas_calceolata.AAC.7
MDWKAFVLKGLCFRCRFDPSGLKTESGPGSGGVVRRQAGLHSCKPQRLKHVNGKAACKKGVVHHRAQLAQAQLCSPLRSLHDASWHACMIRSKTAATHAPNLGHKSQSKGRTSS